MKKEIPLLSNQEIITLVELCNELCVAVNTYDSCFPPKGKAHYLWIFLLSRKNDVWSLLNKLNL
jgi:hypothetical protein